MTYLLSQLWFCLILATILGSVIGWFFRGGCSKKLSLNEEKWETRFARLTSERNSLRMGVRKGEQYKLERNQLISRISIMERAAEISATSLKSNKLNISELTLSSTTLNTNLALERNRVEELSKQASKVQQELNKTQQQKQQLLSELEQTSTKLTSTTNDFISLSSKHSDTEIHHEEAIQQNQTLSSTVKTLKDEQVNALQLKSDLAAAEAKSKSYLNRTSKAEEDSKNTQAKYNALEENLNKSIIRLSDAEVEVATLKSENNELPSLKKQLVENKSIVKSAQKITHKVDAYKAETDNYRAKLIDTESKLEVVTGMLDSEKSSMTMLTQSSDKQINILEDEIKELHAKLDAKSARLSDAETNINKFKSDFNQNTNLTDTVKVELSTAQQQLNDCEKNLKSSKEKNRESSKHIKQLEITKEQNTKTLKDSQEKHIKVRQKLKEAQSSFEEQTLELTDAKIRISKLKEEVSTLKTDLKTNNQKPSQNLDNTKADELSRAESTIKKLENTTKQKELKLQMLAEQLSSAQQQTHQLNDKFAAVQSELDQQNSKGGTKKSLKDYQINEEKLKQELVDIQAQLKKTENQLVGAEACIRNYNVDATKTKKNSKPSVKNKTKFKKQTHTAMDKSTRKGNSNKKNNVKITQQRTPDVKKAVKEMEPVGNAHHSVTKTSSNNNKATTIDSYSDNNDIRNISNLDKKSYNILEQKGLFTIQALLEKHPTLRSIRQTSEKTGIKAPLLESWCNRADLLRIKGVTPDYAELLYASGIRSVQHLALFNVKNLTKKLAKINDINNIVMAPPRKPTVADWVTQATRLKVAIDY